MMPADPVIHFRAKPVTQRLLVRLREEKAVNISGWLRLVVQERLEKEFPDFADYLANADEAPAKPDPQKTPIESDTAATAGPGFATALAQTVYEAFVEWTEDDRERSPAAQDEAGRLSVIPEPDPQKMPIEGWRPRKLPDDQWGAMLEGPRVAGLPDDNQLPGTPIVVTDKRGESWTTTLTEVVDRTDDTIVVRNSGRPHS